MNGIDPAAEHFEPSLRTQEPLRVYALKGRRTLLLWCRDTRNTWKTELADGTAPEPVRNAVIAVETSGAAARVYDPWNNRWSDVAVREGKLTLPLFARSAVVRMDR